MSNSITLQAFGRSRAQARLDQIVRENRFTIAVVFPVVGASVLATSAEGWLPATLAFNPVLLVLGVAVMRSPLIVGLLPIINRRAIIALGALASYTYLIEYTAVLTGWPYGSFAYGVTLGPMVGGIPLVLPLLFIPLTLNAYIVWVLLWDVPIPARFVLVVPTIVLMDIVLDPAAVAIGFWSFHVAGPFYGVPLTNYSGWVLSAAIAFAFVTLAFDPDMIRERADACPYLLDDLVSFVILWGLINAWSGQWLPVLGASGLAILLGLVTLRM